MSSHILIRNAHSDDSNRWRAAFADTIDHTSAVAYAEVFRRVEFTS